MQKAAQANPPLARAADAKRFLAMVAAAGPTQTPETLAEVQKVLSADPDCVPALMASAVAADHQAKFQEAARLYERVLTNFPAFAPATKNLARLYCDNLGDDRKAYSLASKARESLPEDPELSRLCAILAYRQNDLSFSLRLLQDCLRQHDNDADSSLPRHGSIPPQTAQGQPPIPRAPSPSISNPNSPKTPNRPSKPSNDVAGMDNSTLAFLSAFCAGAMALAVVFLE